MAGILELALPASGKAAALRRPTGRDMVEAEILTEQKGGPVAFQVALLSRIASIEGRALPYEDFLEMDAEDIDFLGRQKFTKESPPAPS